MKCHDSNWMDPIGVVNGRATARLSNMHQYTNFRSELELFRRPVPGNNDWDLTAVYRVSGTGSEIQISLHHQTGVYGKKSETIGLYTEDGLDLGLQHNMDPVMGLCMATLKHVRNTNYEILPALKRDRFWSIYIEDVKDQFLLASVHES